MEIKVEYTGTETEQRLAELEHKTHQQTAEVDDEIMKKAIQRRLVLFSHGLMVRDYVIDRNENLVYGGSNSSIAKWKYTDWDKIPAIVAEMVRLSEIKDKNESERKIQKQEREKRQKEAETEKQVARDLIADEINALTKTIKSLEADLQKYKNTVESGRKEAKKQEEQEKIRKIEAKGFEQIEWDREKYKEINECFDDYETLERIRLIDDDATVEMWKDRDTEETITVYSVAGTYFV